MTPRPTWSIYTDTWKMVDKGEYEINKLPLYKLMRKHYCSKNKKRLQHEKELLGMRSANCVRIATQWVKTHIELYQSIKNDGYHPELRGKPISVRIRDDGSFLLLDGTHTVSILMHLGTQKTVTAYVKTRDDGWLTLKRKLHGIYGKKLLYQPINHLDFSDWEVDRHSPHRWVIIKRALKNMVGCSVVDIGCCTGWFSIELAKTGFNITGLDPHETRIMAASILAKYEGLSEDNPKFLTESFEKNLHKNTYDVCLVLSVIHHYLRSDPESFYKAVSIIGKGCNKMILEMGVNRMPIPWAPELVLNHSDYTKYTTLYDGERPIYLYEK